MADRSLINTAVMAGTYGTEPFSDESTQPVTVTLTDVTFTKTANKTLWLDGELEFTITVDNSLGESPITGLVVTDALDETMFTYSNNSIEVEIDGTAITSPDGYTFSITAGIITVTFIAAIPAASMATITFRGTKA